MAASWHVAADLDVRGHGSSWRISRHEADFAETTKLTQSGHRMARRLAFREHDQRFTHMAPDGCGNVTPRTIHEGTGIVASF